MTREEAINRYIIPAITKTWNDKTCRKIIDALLEPKIGHVLDKIRVEISDRLGLLDCKKDILAIIDKYKIESEEV